MTGRTSRSSKDRFICLVGPDGTGKSTLAAALVDVLHPPVLHRHWRPGALPSLRRMAGKPDEGVVTRPHGRPIHGWVKATFRTSYYALDFLLGYFIVFRPILRAGGCVVLERGFEDMAVDPRRYLLPSGRLPSVLLPLVPRPGRMILMQGDPTLIHSRKPELSLAEIASQCDQWRLRLAGRADALVLDVGLTPESLVASVQQWLVTS